MRISRRCERLHYWLFRPFLAQYCLLISGRIPSSRTRGSLVYPEYNAQAQAFFIANPARRYYVKFSDVETITVRSCWCIAIREGSATRSWTRSRCPRPRCRGAHKAASGPASPWRTGLNSAPQAEDYLDGLIAGSR